MEFVFSANDVGPNSSLSQRFTLPVSEIFCEWGDMFFFLVIENVGQNVRTVLQMEAVAA